MEYLRDTSSHWSEFRKCQAGLIWLWIGSVYLYRFQYRFHSATGDGNHYWQQVSPDDYETIFRMMR